MYIDWSRTAPVIVSIAVIIVIAVVRQYSQTLAAITATMPLNIPLGMWIVYAGSDNHQAAMAQFSEAAMMNIFPTIVFLIVAWQLSKVGVSALQTIVVGYIAWAVCLGLIYFIRTLLIK